MQKKKQLLDTQKEILGNRITPVFLLPLTKTRCSWRGGGIEIV